MKECILCFGGIGEDYARDSLPQEERVKRIIRTRMEKGRPYPHITETRPVRVMLATDKYERPLVKMKEEAEDISHLSITYLDSAEKYVCHGWDHEATSCEGCPFYR
jgi:hypothetical protein